MPTHWPKNEEVDTARMQRLSGSIPSSYTIQKVGSLYYRECNIPGGVEDSQTNAAVVIQDAINAGYHVYIKKETYPVTSASDIIIVNEAGHILGDLRQWVGNATFPSPTEVGVVLSYSGDNPADSNDGVLNLRAINDIILENIAIKSDVTSSPYKTMCGIQLSHNTAGTAGPHGFQLRNLEINYFNVGIGALKAGYKSSVDGTFEFVKISNCGTGVEINNTGNFFRRCFWWENAYDVTFVASTYGVHGTTFHKCFLNDATNYTLRFYSGDEGEILFDNCWMEGSTNGIVVIEPANITVRTLTFRDCHLGTAAVAGYIMDFSKINNGLVKIEGCTFDGTSGKTIDINPPTSPGKLVMIDCWKKLDAGISAYPGTRNSGSDSIANGTTSKVVAHGLVVTPSAEHFTITGKENPTNSVGTVWVDTIGAANFTVNVENNPGASGWDFGWKVDVI